MDTNTARGLLEIVVREYGLGKTKLLLHSLGATDETLLEELDTMQAPVGYSLKVARIKLAKQVLGCNLVTAKKFIEKHYSWVDGERFVTGDEHD